VTYIEVEDYVENKKYDLALIDVERSNRRVACQLGEVARRGSLDSSTNNDETAAGR
jgi:hypothetical protein